jgi:hypothetical protein
MIYHITDFVVPSEDAAPMFHCHYTKSARIVQGDNLAAKTLDEAIVEIQRLLVAKPDFAELDGILIWDDSSRPAPE